MSTLCVDMRYPPLTSNDFPPHLVVVHFKICLRILHFYVKWLNLEYRNGIQTKQFEKCSFARINIVLHAYGQFHRNLPHLCVKCIETSLVYLLGWAAHVGWDCWVSLNWLKCVSLFTEWFIVSNKEQPEYNLWIIRATVRISEQGVLLPTLTHSSLCRYLLGGFSATWT